VSTGAKVFLLILILLAILFAAGMGMSIHHKSDSTNNTRDNFKSSDHPVLAAVQRQFSKSSPEVKPVGSGCMGYAVKRLRISASSGCGLKVAVANYVLGIIPPAEYRQVTFKLTRGQISFMHAPDDRVNKGDPDKPHVWNTNEEGKLSVGREGGTLMLMCRTPGGCEIEIE
jgi:hypothetical protein